MATIQNKGPFRSLVAQLDKLARHNRQGSFRTKARYYEACKRFCAYLAAEYHLQKLENISGKHLMSYVLYLQANDKSASTVKTDLAAIRFFHDKMSRPKYTLPTNSELGVELERRRFGQLDRTWSGPEFNRLLGKAMAENRDDFILALYLGRYAGLRIHECFRNQAEPMAEIYTHDPRLMEKLDLLAKKHPDQITRKDAHNFTVPKRCVSVREPYSAERRKAASERAKAAGYQPPMRKSSS